MPTSASEGLHHSEPELVYHYTTTEGLLGIIRSRVLFATHVQFMNDSSELEYSFELFNNVVEEMKFSAPGGDRVLLEQLQRLFSSTKPTIEVFAACMCVDRDLLSQWRGYGAVGGGYALGFDLDQLRRSGAMNGYSLRQVTYDRDEQRRTLQSAVTRHLAKTLSEADGRQRPDVMRDSDKLIATLLDLKHPHFREEKEWRAVALAPRLDSMDPEESKTIELRADRNRLLPFRRFQLATEDGRFPLSKVVIGPREHMDLAEKALRILLKRELVEDVEVVRSDIPLRS